MIYSLSGCIFAGGEVIEVGEKCCGSKSKKKEEKKSCSK